MYSDGVFYRTIHDGTVHGKLKYLGTVKYPSPDFMQFAEGLDRREVIGNFV